MKKITSLLLIAVMIVTILPMSSVSAEPSIKIGDYLYMGTYFGEPILWRCVDIDENGPLMLSDRIICLKAFDAAEGTKGSNDWLESNMRAWLNSDASAGEVEWPCGNPPADSAIWYGYNDYADEAGFLTNFSDIEKSVIKTVTQKSIISLEETKENVSGNTYFNLNYESTIKNALGNYDDAISEQVTDTVFLLDVKQIHKVYKNSYALGKNYYMGKPTQAAVDNSEYKSDRVSPEHNMKYWLRTPAILRGIYGISPEGVVNETTECEGTNGVRPAFYLEDNAEFKLGDGTGSNPYVADESLIAKYGSLTVEDESIISENIAQNSPINIGDYLLMGKYEGEDILWRCVDIDENGPLMLTDKILCRKAFDTDPGDYTETGSHARGRNSYGSNYWEDSNLRSWLNSDASAGEVEWLCGNAPTGENKYDMEAGFLTNFSEAERNAIKPVTQSFLVSQADYEKGVYTSGYEEFQNNYIENLVANYDNAYAVQVTDTVFVLNIKQIYAVYKNSEILGELYYIGEYKKSNVDIPLVYVNGNVDVRRKTHTWLRDGAKNYSNNRNNDVKFSCSDGNIYVKSVEDENVGVRPAFYLNTEADLFRTGSGLYVIDTDAKMSTPSEWAKADIEAANSLGLIPEELLAGFQRPITRFEFCKLAVNLYDKVSAYDYFVLFNDEFSDLSVLPLAESYVIDAALQLGIVTGYDDGTFRPNNEITREEAAVMLARIVGLLGETDTEKVPITFSDFNEVSAWAAEDVSFISAVGIMNGINIGESEIQFQPKGNYSKEQALVTFFRLYNVLNS